MKFEFATAARIVFGPGSLADAVPAMAALGQRALIVTGRDSSRANPLLKLLAKAGVDTVLWPTSGEPTVGQVKEGVAVCRREQCDLVIALGGGSALDAAKAIAGLTTNPGEVTDFLEVIGEGKSLGRPGLPFVAIPTTSGTGTEVTRNAVLASPEHRVKVSLRSPLLLARLAVVDPDLTRGLPSSVATTTGLDALTQLIEPLVSIRANPLVDALCREAMPKAARGLQALHRRDEDSNVREDMAWASLGGGLALANAGLGAVHGFAAPLGGMYPAPHGAICAVLLPHVMAANVAALQKRDPASTSLARYEEVAHLLTGSPTASAEDGIAWVRRLCQSFGIPALREYGVAAEDIPAIADKAASASSMKGNPICLTAEERIAILRAAL